ncbi:Glutaredoxin 3 (Grx3) [Cystobacter fuscus DSM 2262]|uniref:Glutaredoxin n=1 Tax=Cystobacter fuscus (strain ATCC 25194 / DSM 2262 / NBRC 100088 / M29) TaxID=1242864 RepID=S9NWH8_CYSF2|nr:glutaredoxin 3 [Cystobacter fuscus]EPX55256.1 Glutaredoxin 3 (Grx3) [Cystobacter fuscus DSM 2262]
MSHVKIYTKSTCPYSKRAKQLLDAKGVRYEEKVIDLDPSLRGEMIAATTGKTTTPQVFIAGRHIGGSDELLELENSGELDVLLTDSSAQPSA